MEQADLILFLLDISEELSHEDRMLMEMIKGKKAIILLNKTDLPSRVDREDLVSYLEDRRIIEISALKGEGITDLEDAIVEMVFGGEVSIGETGLVSNIRHKNLLEKALNSIEITLDTIQGDLPLELISVDPVSYTHLDVYKRQATYLPWPRKTPG